MSFSDLFGSGEHTRNLGHFAAIVNIASVDGEINSEEQKVLERFARKLDISEDEYSRVVEKPNSFPIHPNNSYENRLERLHDLFTVVFSDHKIDAEEADLLQKYAIGIGFAPDIAREIIKRSIEIFSGRLSFEDYQVLLKRQ